MSADEPILLFHSSDLLCFRASAFQARVETTCNYWVQGWRDTAPTHHGSVIRDVLHWVD